VRQKTEFLLSEAHEINLYACLDAGRSRPTLSPPNADKEPLMVIYIKSQKNVMLHLEDVWPSKQNILIADTIFAEPGP